MSVPPITPPPATGGTSPLAPKKFTQADFLRILVTQLSAQDPFKAADSSKIMENFMTMANFQAAQESSIATKQMAERVETMQRLEQMLLGRNLVGNTVEMKDSSGALISGTVTRVLVDADGVRLDVLGQTLPIENLTSFSSTTPAAP